MMRIVMMVCTIFFNLFSVYSQVVTGPESLQINLVSPSQPAAVESPNAWQYKRMMSYDLNGDGTKENIVILANIVVSSDGKESWDDGQAWEVRIEETDKTVTRVYAQYIQLGLLKGYITMEQGRAGIFLLEETAGGFKGFEIQYIGHGRFNANQLFSRSIKMPIVQPQKLGK